MGTFRQTYSGSGYDIHIKLLNTIFYPESSPIRAEMHKESHLLHIGCQWQDSLAVAPFSARKYPSAEARSRHSQLECFIALHAKQQCKEGIKRNTNRRKCCKKGFRTITIRKKLILFYFSWLVCPCS